jgi:methyl-accepting chemotaxis protein
METSDKPRQQGVFRPKILAHLVQGTRTLKFRLMLLITGVLLLVVGLPVGLFVYHLDKNYHDFSTDMLEITSGLAYQYILDGMMRNDSTAIQENLELLALEPRIRLLRLYRPSGTILYSSHREEIQQNVYQLTDRVYFTRNDGQIASFTRAGNIFAHHHPIHVQKQCTSCHANEGSVIAFLDVHTRFTDSEQIYLYTKHLSVTGGILIIVILWIATTLLYQEQIEARLLTLLRGFDELARENFNFRINMAGRHELALLADRFNKTADKLKKMKTFIRKRWSAPTVW